MSSPPGLARDLLAVLALAAASVALFLPWIVSGSDFLGIAPSSAPPWTVVPDHETRDASGSDALILTWPNLVHWTHSFDSDRGGILWNPLVACGTPFLANQVAFPLYPSNLLAWAGGFRTFLLWAALLHVVLANVGAYLALRRLRLARPACMLGAWCFGAGSWFLAHLDIVNFVQAAAWLPWIVLAVDRAQMERRARDRIVLAAAIALSLLAGMIQVTLLTLLLAAVLARARAEQQARQVGRAAAWRGAGSAAAGIVLGFLLAAPQLLPLAEWASDSSRVRRAAPEADRFAYRPLEWTHLLVPGVLGSPSELSRWTRPTDASDPKSAALLPTDEQSYPPAAFARARGRGATFTESVCSPLAAGLVLILAALGRPSRRALGFLAIAVVSGLLAMDTPFLHAVSALPAGAFANPRRMLLVTAAALAALAAIGAHRILEVRVSRVLALLPAILVLAWIALNAAMPGLVASALAGAGSDPEQARRVPPLFILQAIPACVALALAGAAASWIPGGRWRLAALAAVAFADSFVFQARENPVRKSLPPSLETETTRFLAERVRDPLPPAQGIPVTYEDPAPACRIARFQNAVRSLPTPIPSNAGMLFGFRDEQGYGGILPRRLEEVVEAIEPGIVFEHVLISEWRDAGVFRLPILRFLGVRHVISAHHEIPNLITLRQIPPESVSVFENLGARPRVSVVPRARVFKTEAALLRELAGPGFDPVNEVLLLESDLPGRGLPPTGFDDSIDLGAANPGETVVWRQEGSAAARVEATLSGSRFLVIAESFHPGWKAWDEAGRALPLLPANHAFQAVFLPPGRSRARIAFEPASWTLGLWAAGFGALAAFADIILRRRRTV